MTSVVKASSMMALLIALCGVRAQAQVPTGDQSRAPDERIGVHGDWTITVRNADGSLASRHSFSNALTASSGAVILADVFGHTGPIPNKWVVNMSGSPQACLSSSSPNAGPGSCLIAEPGTPTGFGARNLVATAPQSGADAGKLVLEGSIRTAFSGVISSVNTLLFCTTPGLPTSSACNGKFSMTSHGLGASAITVQANQTIDVIVKISFS